MEVRRKTPRSLPCVVSVDWFEQGGHLLASLTGGFPAEPMKRNIE